MDAIDKKILTILLSNSRMPIVSLAKKIRISREMTQYRINRLEKEGIIQDFISQIDLSKLGFIGAAVFINIKATHQKKFKEYLEKLTFVSWVAELSGVWNFGMTLIGKSNDELDKRFLEIYTQFNDSIIDHRFILHKKNSFFYEKYFIDNNIEGKQSSKQIPSKIDEQDKIILKELSLNSRIDSVALSKKVNLSAPAVATRIKRLVTSHIIEKFSLFIDTSKLELFQYSIFFVNKDVNQKALFLNHLRDHSNISFIAEYIGDQFIECGVFVKNPYDLRNILQGIEEKFPLNRVTEISLFQKEFVSVGPPRCVFE